MRRRSLIQRAPTGGGVPSPAFSRSRASFLRDAPLTSCVAAHDLLHQPEPCLLPMALLIGRRLGDDGFGAITTKIAAPGGARRPIRPRWHRRSGAGRRHG